RTATFIACAVAALELAVLVAIGVVALGRSVAHRVQDAAVAKVADVPPIPKETPPGAPKLTRGETDVLVLNGSGVSGAAGAAADRLSARGYQITAVGNAARKSSATRTHVLYRRGSRAEAARPYLQPMASIIDRLTRMRAES